MSGQPRRKMVVGLSTAHWMVPKVHVGDIQRMDAERVRNLSTVQLGARTEVQVTVWGTSPD